MSTDLKCIIFDMDGVMFDTEALCINAWDYAGEKLNIGRAGYMVLKTLGMNVNAAEKILKAEFGPGFSTEILQKHAKIYFDNYFKENGVPVKKGLYELLEFLKNSGYKLGVASSSSKNSVMHHLNDADITKYFDVIICGDMTDKSKPEPDIYLKACACLRENPENCFAIEDSKNGIISAYRAGCKTIMVPDLWQGDKETDLLLYGKFNSLLEVKTHFEKIVKNL